MSRFQLPLLEPHREALEKCVYCPKLSRAACPVSNVEANEALTPWGKMSMAYFAARGDVPLDEEHAKTAWACSACYACRERCDHRNEVATVLHEARAEMFARGLAPLAARKVADEAEAREREHRQAIAELTAAPRTTSARTAVLLGCSYVRHHPSIAAEGWRLTRRFAGDEVRAIGACCGLPRYHAGDRPGFRAAAERLADEVRGAERIVAVDPGCAVALTSHYPRLGVALPEVVPFVDLVYRDLARLPRGALAGRSLRWTDPCQLGRGLGRYDEPRAILTWLGGDPPAGFLRERELGECSGGGGLLPVVYPEASRAIADERIAEHRRRGGGTLVTACAESLRRYRSRGEDAADLIELVAEACVP